METEKKKWCIQVSLIPYTHTHMHIEIKVEKCVDLVAHTHTNTHASVSCLCSMSYHPDGLCQLYKETGPKQLAQETEAPGPQDPLGQAPQATPSTNPPCQWRHRQLQPNIHI